jgi:hypothetical protein
MDYPVRRWVVVALRPKLKSIWQLSLTQARLSKMLGDEKIRLPPYLFNSLLSILIIWRTDSI